MKVRFFNEVRQYLKLNYDNVTFEDTPVSPNQCARFMNAGKEATHSRKDYYITIADIGDNGIIKVEVKIDMQQYYKDEIKK